MPRLTGGEIVAEFLISRGVPYVFGIPGHGDVCLFDALVDRKDRIQARPVYHEQSAVHIADAYYRVSGQPCAVFTSIGPGACNTVVGVGQAFVDSTAVMVITGSTHTYMRGHSVLQELDRYQWSDFPNVLKPLTKQNWQPSRVGQLPFVLHRAWNQMMGGRRGPVHIDLPMDVQAEAAEVELAPPGTREAAMKLRPAADDVERAAELLYSASRPVIIMGGGVITANASDLAVAIGEQIGAAMVNTWNGKGAVPADHPLYGWQPGSPGSSVGNRLCHEADVILSLGCRFTDWSSSSYHSDHSFDMRGGRTRLIQVDIDPVEMGKNYPFEIGMVADARIAAQDILAALRQLGPARDWRNSGYTRHIEALRQEWYELLRPAQTYGGTPTTISRALAEVRNALPRSGIVVSGAGLVQNQTYQEFRIYEPRTHITSGGFSTMGFTVPGAIGAKLAAPDRAVVGLAGDGDFLQTVQEIGLCKQFGLPVVFVVMNNTGFSSIRNLQEGAFGVDRTIVTEFKTPDGADYSPNLAEVARAFGLRGERVTAADRVAGAVRDALDAGEPAVVEVMVNKAGLTKSGWWDIPIPEYLPGHADWQENRKKEQI